ncbi:hypothetical protein A2686_04325 [Candidatus Woesebacteria bacterium RIFCSPHIGHO2_01_FULL_38_10]|uniref:Uncharacterized protein n=1 Tax=Candidatus Woesebacteria bacterium RIFCSPLOWO2_01_FULL_39_10b TaxID=1802517 RepID=A0A1F8B8E7_9BACT|nr:MAG: hypothetical protein A2686_04325 [Candidatus Woesebacteria bacterium RIFCSPHIGHO2_01_FULL_38_10]OGM60302.1 MAG: hypothetical protein A2892_03075 [Candidatus Woesebacteria bacterium RIFCSPLOWO2_01_FULL_39_10b]
MKSKNKVRKRVSGKASARKKEIKLRKNFFPAMLLTILLWLGVVFIIYFVNPSDLGAVQLFFIISFLASLFTFSTLLANTRRGLLIAIGLTIFLVLRYLGVGNILNLLLILGLTITTEIYFSKKKF